MSLIGDALRKARQEAADRESDRKGILFSAKIAEGPTRSNLGLGLALGAVIAVVATVAGGGAVWWLLRGETTQRVSLETNPTNAAAVETTDDPSSPTSDSSPTNTRDESQDAPTVDVPPKAAAQADSAASTADRPVPQPRAVAERRVITAGEDEESAEGFAGVEDGAEVYVMVADLGEARFSLDFIVSRTEDPFAEINGVEVHIGGTIEGFRIKSIEPDRVTLSNGRRTIVLRAP